MKISLPDDLYEDCGNSEDLIVALLRRAQVLATDTHALVIPERERAQLADLLGGLPVRSAATLVERVQALADLSIGKIRIPFTPAELTEIKTKADRLGWPVERVLQAIVKQVKTEWYNVPVRG
jgi:hypothetical protein